MTLIEAICDLDALSDDVVIYVREPWERESECVLLEMDAESADVPDQEVAEARGFSYFLEVLIIREVFDGWSGNLGRTPTPEELCDRVIHYAMHDA